MKKIIIMVIIMSIAVIGCTFAQTRTEAKYRGRGINVEFLKDSPGSKINMNMPNFLGVKFTNYMLEPININYRVYSDEGSIDEAGTLNLDQATSEKKYVPNEKFVNYKLQNLSANKVQFFAAADYVGSRKYNAVVCVGKCQKVTLLTNNTNSTSLDPVIISSVATKSQGNEDTGYYVNVNFNIENAGATSGSGKGRLNSLKFLIKSEIGLSCYSENSKSKGTDLELVLGGNRTAKVNCNTDPDKPLQVIEANYVLDIDLDFSYNYKISTGQMQVIGSK